MTIATGSEDLGMELETRETATPWKENDNGNAFIDDSRAGGLSWVESGRSARVTRMVPH